MAIIPKDDLGLPSQDSDISTLAIIARLIIEFARAEAYVHLLVCRRSGLGDIGARPVFSGNALR